MSTIPASDIVTINPSVIGAGGTALSLNGLLLTSSTRIPLGTVLSFAIQAAVEAYFGATSQEASEASVYFAGFDGSNAKPAALLMAQYNTGAVSAYLRGGQVSGLSLTQLQALSGVLTVTIDGTQKTSSPISLSGATSFSNAAQIINKALGQTGPQDGSVTGSIASTTLTVTAVGSGKISVGDVLSGTGITTGTTVTALGTGTGGTGTYTVDTSQTAASTTITATLPTVTYDSLSGAFTVTSPTTGTSSTLTYGSGTIAAALKLDQADGAVLSAGAIAATPAAFMGSIIATTQNWASFWTTFEPSTSDKVAFGTWVGQQNNRYLYAMWDTDITVTQGAAPNSAGGQLVAAAASGTVPIYEPSNLYHAAFLCGAIASIDFTQTNGRATLDFKNQSGLTVAVTSQQIATQLRANGYNFVGAWATATTQFNFFNPGSVTGPFKWIDSYVDEINMNAQLQQAMLTLLTNVKSIPYNNQGYTLIRAACLDPINQALNFGAIRQNVPLSAAQAAEVNAAAGLKIDDVLSSVGWYLQVLPASATVRANRGSPPITLWYTDGGSVQQINVGSVSVQ